MKTTIASKFPRPIVLAFEKGYNFIPGIIAQPINDWKEALEAKKALIKDAKDAKKEGRETVYKSVICDTGDLAYDFCEAFIVDKEGVDYLDETEKMRGYRATSREFDNFFQDICRAGYTLVVISHSTSKQIKENGEKYEKTIPTIVDRGLQVISRLVDVIGFANKETDDETGATTHTLTLKGNKYLEAGSRNPYLPEKIPLSYDALLKAMQEAIDKIEENGGEVTDEVINPLEHEEEKVDFKETLKSIAKHAKAMYNADYEEEYKKIVGEYLGYNASVKECTPQQIDHMVLILQDLQDFVKENNITVE